MNYTNNLNYGASGRLIGNARALRKRMTPAEDLLWANLRNRRLSGLKFRRQHPVDVFVADFYCYEKRLIVEVDGGIHLRKDQIEYDQNRTVVLNELGIDVIRFTNDEVLNSMIEVLKKILDYCSVR